ncbi:MAG: transcriptional regulator [Planctomycetota bacterium]|nr:MAG: transcriptional regulator [Planctomycetota bacterium]RKY11591.1 MAG: transcriptional regulator [Planctomycetota bacterium]
MKNTKVDNLVRELSKKGMLKTREILTLGISKEYLRKLKEKGVVERITRGLYTLPDHAFSATQSIAEVSNQIPRGVICLLSALRLHGFTTQAPFEVWIAVEQKASISQINSTTQIKYIWFSGKAFTAGVQTKTANNVKVYCPAKTVADCFKYRNKIGLDVALEALREGWRENLFTMDELWEYAKICRVSNIMRPYLESLISS